MSNAAEIKQANKPSKKISESLILAVDVETTGLSIGEDKSLN